MKLEQFKSTMLTAFPSQKNYKLLYGDDDPENEIIDRAPETAEEELDLLEMLKGIKVNDTMVP